jgi:hypothetical protein
MLKVIMLIVVAPHEQQLIALLLKELDVYQQSIRCNVYSLM